MRTAKSSKLGYRISSLFGRGLSFTGSDRLIGEEVVEVLLDKPKDKTAITARHLKLADQEWLTMGSSELDWSVDIVKLKARFQIDNLSWLPEATIECKAEDFGDHLKIRITPGSFDRSV